MQPRPHGKEKDNNGTKNGRNDRFGHESPMPTFLLVIVVMGNMDINTARKKTYHPIMFQPSAWPAGTSRTREEQPATLLSLVLANFAFVKSSRASRLFALIGWFRIAALERKRCRPLPVRGWPRRWRRRPAPRCWHTSPLLSAARHLTKAGVPCGE